MTDFEIISKYKPAGDQPRAIESLIGGINQGKKDQVLLGITGSGKTFTMANVISDLKRPALIMSHNKTLAGQIYNEFKEIFPNNAVEYFVSYYDYYQPEAYIPRSDTYIEKDSSINEQIDLLRHSATRSLLERRDVIVIASVSCIYGLGSPQLYSDMTLFLKKGESYSRQKMLDRLIQLQYTRNDVAFERGSFRVKGENIDIFPAHYEKRAWRLSFFGDELEEIIEFDPLTGKKNQQMESVVIYARSHYVTPRDVLDKCIPQIKNDLQIRLAVLRAEGKDVEAQRLGQRVQYDLEMLVETGSCKGIENYSRYLTGGKPGDPPPTLFEYLPDDALLFIDESHVSVPQIMAMYNGDKARKTNLVDYGFRLPAALDNRPLKFEEWNNMRPQTIFVSATPAAFELNETQGEVIEQIIRPTGLLDPICIIRPVENQVKDVMQEIKKVTASGCRTLVTTLTKRNSEDLANFLQENGIKATYLHSDVHTLERMEIIDDLRKGEIDVLIGINLLREGLDIPECSLVAILDADKAGFLRSEVALIQTIGRAARNAEGRVLLYADHMTKALELAISETNRRRITQEEYNKQNNISPRTIERKISTNLMQKSAMAEDEMPEFIADPKMLNKKITDLKKIMIKAASELDFEEAAKIRDQVSKLEKMNLDMV